MTENNEGWGWAMGQRKAHYYRAGRSLCRHWSSMLFKAAGIRLEQGNDESPDNCVACRKRLAQSKAVAGGER